MLGMSSPSAKTIYAVDFSHWKRKPLASCFPESELRLVSHIDQVPDNVVLAVWGMRATNEAEKRGIAVLRIEDGFLRSVGLGADLVRPLSWVVDSRGIYYDASRPSDLEVLLMQARFEEALLERAQAFRERIVSLGLTKYNVGHGRWRRPQQAKRVILVPGQVESDAAIAYGAPRIKTNLELLKAVRAANPGAYLLYKPHPDVVAGLRKKGKGEEDATRWCDELIVDAPMSELLLEVDEVHCLTSLAGFEALLRGKKVTCYGQPFYSGWGLTEDKVPVVRRTRRLSLDELVTGVLILYPRYMSRKRDALISPEEALDELAEWQARSPLRDPWWRGIYRMILRRVVGIR